VEFPIGYDDLEIGPCAGLWMHNGYEACRANTYHRLTCCFFG